MDRREENKVLVDTIDKAEVKHPVNAVDCNHKQDAGYAVTCDKCSDKHICMWEN